MTVIHWYRPQGVDDRHATKVSIYEEGTVSEIERRLILTNRSQGHRVTERGGNFTGPDGGAIALFFDLDVTLESGYSMTWEHAVCEPSEPWIRSTTGTPEAAREPRDTAPASHVEKEKAE